MCRIDLSKYVPFLVGSALFIYKVTDFTFQSAVRIHLQSTIKDIYSPIPSGTPESNISQPTDKNEEAVERDQLIQQWASLYLMIYRILLNLPATISSLAFGLCTNRISHAWFMILPCVGALAACLSIGLGLLPYLRPMPDKILLILTASLFCGVTGKSNALTMGANSYASKASSRQNRTVRLGRLLGIGFAGLSIGSALVAVFFRFFGIQQILFLVVASNLLTIIILAICVPVLKPVSGKKENLADQTSSSSGGCGCQNLGKSIKSSYKFVFHQTSGKSRLILFALFVIVFANQITKNGEQDVLLVYLSSSPFNFRPEVYCYLITTYYVCMSLNAIVILPVLTNCLSLTDTTLMMLGIGLSVVKLVTIGLVDTIVPVFIASIAGSAAAYISITLRSLISKVVDANDVGTSFAIVSCLETLASLVGGALFTGVYNASLSTRPGAIFLFDAGLHLVILAIVVWLKVNLKKVELIGESEGESSNDNDPTTVQSRV